MDGPFTINDDISDLHFSDTETVPTQNNGNIYLQKIASLQIVYISASFTNVGTSYIQLNYIIPEKYRPPRNIMLTFGDNNADVRGIMIFDSGTLVIKEASHNGAYGSGLYRSAT